MLNSYKCVLQIHYTPWYNPQHLYLTKKPLKWVDFFVTYVRVPECYHTFLTETRHRVLPKSKRDIQNQFGVKIPTRVEKTRWKIYKYNKKSNAPVRPIQ